MGESLEVKRTELIAIKGTSLQIEASELVVEDLGVAEGEGQEDSQPKAWDPSSTPPQVVTVKNFSRHRQMFPGREVHNHPS